MQQFTQVGRITSLHGTFLPPKKILTVKKYVTLRFKILGTIPSKKNMLWAASNILKIVGKLTACKTVPETLQCLKDHYRCFIKNSGKYQEWMREMQPIIAEQMQKEISRYQGQDIIYPLERVSVKIYHYWKDDLERDLDNKQSTIYDLLKNCGVIVNDNWQCLRKIHSECENYHGQILETITTIDVTYMII